ncbi:spermidine synthase [Bdellovibrio sp. HCB288]|uniref:spermidine synthase n=1 Tax=Bdellovibrio sp. HCB288 TaxID=3394355 RepID=UPI0039B6D7FC
MILLLALFSGLLNLSAQVLYQKVVSVTLGDLYTTYILVTLLFICGAALGNLFSSKLRKHLPLLEVLTGIYNILLFFKNPPDTLLIASLLIPAFCLGAQLPLYSYYLRQIRYRWIYSLYHLGAMAGLLAFEVYFTHGLSIRTALAALGLAQISLGIALYIFAKKDRFHLTSNPQIHLKKFFAPGHRLSIFAVLAISTLSYYQIFWAVKTQTFLTEAFRLQATLITMAVFFWMSFAGAVEKWGKTVPRAALFIAWACALLIIQLCFPNLPVWLRDAMSGSLANYLALSFIQALFLTIPVLFSSLMFIRGAEVISEDMAIDESSSLLNIIASAGNTVGMLAAVLMSSQLWFNSYFATAIVAASACALIFAHFENRYFKTAITLVGVAILAFFAFKNRQADSLLGNRLSKEARAQSIPSTTTIHSEAFSSIAIHNTLSNIPPHEPVRMYYIDGHASHDLNLFTENLVGLIAAPYFPGTIDKSLVIGVGSGQTSWGVAAISTNTELVEISPAVRKTLNLFSFENNQLATRPGIQLHLQDGMNFLKACPTATYDLIVNTSTYPGNFNAGKLFTDEFLSLAVSCLKAEGVYQTYFDIASVIDIKQRAEFLAPLQKHFKHVDIVKIPYPIVIAYNTPRELRKTRISDLLKNKDLEFYQNTLVNKASFKEPCFPVYRDIPAAQEARMNTLDESILEANSISNMVQALNPHFLGVHLQDTTSDLKSSGCWQPEP